MQSDEIKNVQPLLQQHTVSGSVSVVHCKKDKYDIYIGRPSKWGNPLKERKLKHLLNDLHDLKGKTLGCWCKPQSCHGDVLAELVALHCR